MITHTIHWLNTTSFWLNTTEHVQNTKEQNWKHSYRNGTHWMNDNYCGEWTDSLFVKWQAAVTWTIFIHSEWIHSEQFHTQLFTWNLNLNRDSYPTVYMDRYIPLVFRMAAHSEWKCTCKHLSLFHSIPFWCSKHQTI